MARALEIKQLSKKLFSQGQIWAATQVDPRLQYLASLRKGSPLRVLDLGEDDHDNCSYLGLKPNTKSPVIVEHGGQVFAAGVNDVLKAEADEDRGLLLGGESLCIAQPLSAEDLGGIRSCTHDWVVHATVLAEGWLVLGCLHCGAHGSVDDPTADEWVKATPYSWEDKGRVTIRGKFDQ